MSQHSVNIVKDKLDSRSGQARGSMEKKLQPAEHPVANEPLINIQNVSP